MHAAGWAGISWPKEYGGRGATLVEQAVFGEEMARVRAPSPANVLGLVMGGPVVIAHGSEDQKERYLYPTLRGEKKPFFGLTEPSGGSDPARAIQTKAERKDNGWVLNGAKIFISGADLRVPEGYTNALGIAGTGSGLDEPFPSPSEVSHGSAHHPVRDRSPDLRRRLHPQQRARQARRRAVQGLGRAVGGGALARRGGLALREGGLRGPPRALLGGL
jgi:hypothetical protein